MYRRKGGEGGREREREKATGRAIVVGSVRPSARPSVSAVKSDPRVSCFPGGGGDGGGRVGLLDGDALRS